MIDPSVDAGTRDLNHPHSIRVVLSTTTVVNSATERRSHVSACSTRSYPCAVALIGTVLFAATEALLLERFRRVVLMLDGDDSGRQANSRIAAQLTGKCSVQMVAVPTGGQPDQLNRAQIAALLEGSLGSEASNE